MRFGRHGSNGNSGEESADPPATARDVATKRSARARAAESRPRARGVNIAPIHARKLEKEAWALDSALGLDRRSQFRACGRGERGGWSKFDSPSCFAFLSFFCARGMGTSFCVVCLCVLCVEHCYMFCVNEEGRRLGRRDLFQEEAGERERSFRSPSRNQSNPTRAAPRADRHAHPAPVLLRSLIRAFFSFCAGAVVGTARRR